MRTLLWQATDKNADKHILVCRIHGEKALRVRSEPVKKKRHTMNAHRRRVVVVCIKCKKLKTIRYGAAPGRRKSQKP